MNNREYTTCTGWQYIQIFLVVASLIPLPTVLTSLSSCSRSIGAEAVQDGCVSGSGQLGIGGGGYCHWFRRINIISISERLVFSLARKGISLVVNGTRRKRAKQRSVGGPPRYEKGVVASRLLQEKTFLWRNPWTTIGSLERCHYCVSVVSRLYIVLAL